MKQRVPTSNRLKWVTGESRILLNIKKGCRRTPNITPRCLYVYSISEVVLDSKLTTQTKVIIVISSQEGNLTIYSKGIRDRQTKTSFTRELGLSVFTINCHYSRTSLYIVGSTRVTQSTFMPTWMSVVAPE